MPLKRHYIDFQAQTNNKVTPDEIDAYQQYQVINPGISATAIGSATAGTVSQVVALGIANTVMDYPRTLLATWTGSASNSGTVHVVGKDQFGVSITEDLALAQGTQWTGTDATEKIFAEVSAATATMGTGVTGTGTVSLGYAIAPTTAAFGLPSKIAAASDVKAITWTNETGLSIPLNGGTIAAYVGTAYHEFSGTETLEGTTTLSVLMRSTYKAPGDAYTLMSNL
jgi:hypothetical protein